MSPLCLIQCCYSSLLHNQGSICPWTIRSSSRKSGQGKGRGQSNWKVSSKGNVCFVSFLFNPASVFLPGVGAISLVFAGVLLPIVRNMFQRHSVTPGRYSCPDFSVAAPVLEPLPVGGDVEMCRASYFSPYLSPNQLLGLLKLQGLEVWILLDIAFSANEQDKLTNKTF